MSKVTIKKIAELAGVSPTTVSFVLNNNVGVSAKTRQRVLEIIKQQQYTPNINSRRLILQRSFNIAFVTGDNYALFTDSFANSVSRALVESANELGYNVMLMPTLRDDRSSKLLQAIQQGNVDGVVFFQDISDELAASLAASKIPMIVVDSHKPGAPYPCIRIDYEKAAYTAARYLIKCGHRRIAYMGIELLPHFNRAVFAGYRKALEKYGVPFYESWCNSTGNNEVTGYSAARTLLAGRGERPTAVLCANDIVSVGAMQYVRQNGCDVPGDISFISIDDIPNAKYYYPAITTIHLDSSEMGRLAMEMLNDEINGRLENRCRTLRSDMLVVRETVRDLTQG